ncbi:uncharacterized protein THITE_2122138 [Thermothielavioides terrestris NRRL 8126]|uniref:Protein kinase domain-containing protein n=1 Tax=Thermothielavioides terrestris (strain ATCC 38088 / NRRL 8126) TaxID=578455 RepID=G2RCA2_THETT|nr:uncharacterized protein THITE_2122138 [Thermothielavioides terrestris NRRL 8126]AEO70537.1 hypothetical protein THITE_2122138 [Thermothielavioides terrestris NRRL 8126]
MQASRPLPWFRGPKLGPFKFRDEANRDITFLEHLGGGVHAEVFRVMIDDSIYALKLFRFVHPTMVIQPNVLRDGTASIEDVINQNDPFHCECRAYGRLKEVGREDLAVHCYGYVLLSRRHEHDLAQLGFTDWDRRDAVKDRPIRGIVKEYIADDGSGPFTFEMLPRMRQDIIDLNRLGIVVWDVRADNYRAGRIVDFSQAHTAPHMELDWNSTAYARSQVMDCCVRDRACFDDMIEEWNENHPDQKFWRRFMPNLAFGQRLRDMTRYRESLYRQEGAKFDAAFYDWEKKRSTSSSPRAVQSPRSDRKTRRERATNGSVSKKRNVRRRGRRRGTANHPG